jgi:hypothetical protein
MTKMTDTVNVERAWVDRFIAWVEAFKGTAPEGTVDEMFSLYTDARRFVLAAAPKAEPEWRETSLTTDPINSKIWVCAMENGVGGRVCVSGPSPADAQVSARAAAADYDRRIAHPEAPKVEQEPVAWRYRVRRSLSTPAPPQSAMNCWRLWRPS